VLRSCTVYQAREPLVVGPLRGTITLGRNALDGMVGTRGGLGEPRPVCPPP
jgi:hypothetical protein